MVTKFYCHLCKLQSAYKSIAYPEVVVCRCTGKILEVGKIVKGQYFSNQAYSKEELEILTSLSRAHTDDSWQKDLIRRAMSNPSYSYPPIDEEQK